MSTSYILPTQYPFDFLNIHSSLLIPPKSYQRNLESKRSDAIAAEFDERVANEPKVSFRNGKYYVFDGQHTIDARKTINRHCDLPIRCKVFYDMTEADEAALFAKQTGVSKPLTPGQEVKAYVVARDSFTLKFVKATESMGCTLDLDHNHGENRIACIGTAKKIYRSAGEETYKETLRIILDAWKGDSCSLSRVNLIAISMFVSKYHNQYDRWRLIHNLRRVDPLTIAREGDNYWVKFRGNKRFLYQVYRIYNGDRKSGQLPVRF